MGKKIYLQRRPGDFCENCYILDNWDYFCESKFEKYCNHGKCIAGPDKVLKQVIPKRLIKSERTVADIRKSELYKTLKNR